MRTFIATLVLPAVAAPAPFNKGQCVIVTPTGQVHHFSIPNEKAELIDDPEIWVLNQLRQIFVVGVSALPHGSIPEVRVTDTSAQIHTITVEYDS